MNDKRRRACEDRINEFAQFTTTIEDISIHFVALFSEKEDAVPIVLLHGWPGNAASCLGKWVISHKRIYL